ncbi:unnamed protein product, partial [Rotaria sp. Silwood1]
GFNNGSSNGLLSCVDGENNNNEESNGIVV